MADSGYTAPPTTNRTAAMTEPQTEAGRALMRFMGWGPAWAKKILAIEREAAAAPDRAAPRTEAAVSEFVSFEGTPEEHQRARAMAARFAGDRDRREAAAPGAAALDRIAELEAALQQDANVIHYGRHTKYPEEHSERFEDCTFLRCVVRRDLLGARAAEPKPPESGE